MTGGTEADGSPLGYREARALGLNVNRAHIIAEHQGGSGIVVFTAARTANYPKMYRLEAATTRAAVVSDYRIEVWVRFDYGPSPIPVDINYSS